MNPYVQPSPEHSITIISTASYLSEAHDWVRSEKQTRLDLMNNITLQEKHIYIYIALISEHLLLPDRMMLTCLVSEREARYHDQTCRHVSPHAAEWRSLQLLVAVYRILSTLRALSSLRSLARCARHTIMQHLRVSVYLCICVYLDVFACICA